MNPAHTAQQTARRISAAQHRGVRRTTWVVSLIALAIYVGFIIMTLIRIHR